MYHSTRSARLFCSRSTRVSTVRVMRSSLRSRASRRSCELVLVLEPREQAVEPGQLPEHVGLLADLDPAHHLVLREERVADVAQEVPVLRGRAPAPLQAQGERLDRVEDGGEARLVVAEDDALGQHVGDHLQRLDGDLVQDDLPALDPVLAGGVDAEPRLLGLALRVGLAHEAGELVDEGDLLERVHAEEDDRPVAEEGGVLPLAGRDQERVRGEALGGLEALEVDPLPEQEGADRDDAARGVETGHGAPPPPAYQRAGVRVVGPGSSGPRHTSVIRVPYLLAGDSNAHRTSTVPPPVPGAAAGRPGAGTSLLPAHEPSRRTRTPPRRRRRATRGRSSSSSRTAPRRKPGFARPPKPTTGRGGRPGRGRGSR